MCSLDVVLAAGGSDWVEVLARSLGWGREGCEGWAIMLSADIDLYILSLPDVPFAATMT